MSSGNATGFFDACKAGDDSTVRAMLDQDPSLASGRAPTGETPLIAALYRGHQSTVDLLVDAGAPLDIFTAAALGRVDAAEASLQEDPTSVRQQSYDGWTPLHLAAFFGHAAAVTLLLQRGADPHAVDAEDRTPLARAAARNHAAVIDLITLSK